GIFVNHVVRAREVQEHGSGSGMATGPETDGYVALSHDVVSTHDVVNAFHLVIDMLHAWVRRREKRNLVVHFVYAQQGSIANTVTDLGPQQLRPEFFVPPCIKSAQTNMTESGNTCVARCKVTDSAVMRLVNKLDSIAGWIVKGNEFAHMTLFGFGGRALVNLVSLCFQ